MGWKEEHGARSGGHSERGRWAALGSLLSSPNLEVLHNTKVRFWWIIIRMATGSGNQEYITNRLALLLFFTAFALVVFHW